jgi:hypothetical protein
VSHSGGFRFAISEVPQRLSQGRLRYVTVAAIVAGWALLALLVALATASGVVWF